MNIATLTRLLSRLAWKVVLGCQYISFLHGSGSIANGAGTEVEANKLSEAQELKRRLERKNVYLRSENRFYSDEIEILGKSAAFRAALTLNYAPDGDSMSLSFLAQEKKMTGLNLNTYLDDPKDTVTLMVAFASLPHGTNYPGQIVLNATAKKIQVTTNNMNYQQVVP